MTEIKNPRIALIGCGAIAEALYLPAFVKSPELLAGLVLVDTNETRLHQLAQKFNVKQCQTDYRQCEVDGAIVAVPHHLHHRISMDFLARNRHVLCEKPLAEHSWEAREMVAQAQASGVTLSVNLTRRLLPTYRKVKQMITHGELGALKRFDYLDGEYFQWPTVSGFYFKKASPAGVLLDRGTHSVDLICWLLGAKPEVISAQNDSFGGFEGCAVLRLQHGDCQIHLKTTWLQRMDNYFRISGEKGTVEGALSKWSSIQFTDPNGHTRKIKLNEESPEYNAFGFKLVRNFADVIRGMAQPLIPAQEVLPSVELIEECYARSTHLPMPWYDAITKPSNETSAVTQPVINPQSPQQVKEGNLVQ